MYLDLRKRSSHLQRFTDLVVKVDVVLISKDTTYTTISRFAKNDYRQTTSVTQLLVDLDWFPLSVRRRNAWLVQFYKAYNNNSPINLSDFQRPSRHTRSSCDGFSLIVPQTSSDVYKYSFIPRTVVDWNSCALATRQKLSLDSFKSALFNSSCPSN